MCSSVAVTARLFAGAENVSPTASMIFVASPETTVTAVPVIAVTITAMPHFRSLLTEVCFAG